MLRSMDRIFAICSDKGVMRMFSHLFAPKIVFSKNDAIQYHCTTQKTVWLAWKVLFKLTEATEGKISDALKTYTKNHSGQGMFTVL